MANGQGNKVIAPAVTANINSMGSVVSRELLDMSPARPSSSSRYFAEEANHHLNIDGLKSHKSDSQKAPTNELASGGTEISNSQPSPRKFIFRSNSEVYLKSMDMQDENDIFTVPMPIQYVAEVTHYDPTNSQAHMLVIDSSQLNNLTRHMDTSSFNKFNNLYQHASIGTS